MRNEYFCILLHPSPSPAIVPPASLRQVTLGFHGPYPKSIVMVSTPHWQFAIRIVSANGGLRKLPSSSCLKFRLLSPISQR
jgi:hypothetical protein